MRAVFVKNGNVARWAAYYLVKKIESFAPTQARPFVLGLPTGSTPLEMYKTLIELYNDGLVSFRHVITFNMDEYFGLSKEDRQSYNYYMRENFFKYIDIPEDQIHILDGSNPDFKEECRLYEAKIAELGPIHLFVGGMGEDGHIAFNEPGSSLRSRTRDKELTYDTRVVNSRFFEGDVSKVPRLALTVGVQTILDAEEVLVLASGEKKASAVRAAIEGPVSAQWTISAIQMHPQAIVVADESACTQIRVGTYRYYKELEEENIDVEGTLMALYKRHALQGKALTALCNCKIFTGDKTLTGYSIILKGSKIWKIVPEDSLAHHERLLGFPFQRVDLGGDLAAPGFIDLQINGCGGVLLNDDISRNTMRVMNETVLRHGCTSFLPTLITTTDEKMDELIQMSYSLDKEPLAGVIGLHLEGPYISVEKRGVHNADYVRRPSKSMLSEVARSGHVKVVTLAPELVPYEEIQILSQAGIKVSVGHTQATYKELREKEEAGISLITHLYNAMPSFSSREPGPVGYAFDSHSIMAGIIADGFHVDFTSIEVAKRLMKDHLFLVTDAVTPAGSDLEDFMFEGEKVYYKDGRCQTAEGALAGSALTMDQAVRNIIKNLGLDRSEALRMASLYPARALDIDDHYGLIKDGYEANIVVLSGDNDVKMVFQNGERKV